MPIIHTTVFQCDICSAKKENTLNGELPYLWQKLTFEHPMEERSWYDKIVCQKCVEQIVKEHKKAGK